MLTLAKRSSRKAAVSLIFAIALVPLLMMVGLAIDFGFYTGAQSQLDLAADASALHAARIAVQVYQNDNQANGQKNIADALEKGQKAGMAWFAAQLGKVPEAKSTITPVIELRFNQGANQIEANVTYAGVILTNFVGLFPGHWPEYPNWGIAGAATAVISTLTYNEFDFVVDDSSSMLIADGPADIQRLEGLTPCSTQATNVARTTVQDLFGGYSWYYDPRGTLDNKSTTKAAWNPAIFLPYGYGTFTYTATIAPYSKKQVTENDVLLPIKNKIGKCDPAFYGNAVAGGYASECFYVPGQTNALAAPLLTPPLDANTGLCTKTASGVIGGGTSQHIINPPMGQTVTVQGVPQAPCAFACHTDPGNNDYFGLARANGVKLRFDVIQSALTAQSLGVIPTLESYVQNSGNLNPVTVGVFYYNAGFTAAVTPSPQENSLQALQAAETTVEGLPVEVVKDDADTNTPQALQRMYQIYNAAGKVGSGNQPMEPKKNMFLITDGLEDYNDPLTGRQQGALGVHTYNGINSLAQCQAIKALGVRIYVLYTTYYPLPNPYYLEYDKPYAEPTGQGSPIYKRLEQCASPGTATNPTILEASDSSDIGLQLNRLLESALNAPGRLSN